MNRIVLDRRLSGGVTVTVDGVRLDAAPSLAIRNHSPNGFEFGYAGSGPAQTALAILLHVVGARNADEWWRGGDAERVYQDFKTEFIAPIENRYRRVDIEVDVRAWVDAKLQERSA